MKINGFGKRFLSLLLAMVALVGLLSVGAMADETAPSVTLEVKNVQRTGDEVTAEIWATGTADGKALDTTTGIVMCSVQLDIPSGLELTKITKNADAIANDEITYQPTDLDEGLIVLNAATTKKDADGNKLFVAWTGGLVARLTFSIKDGAFGEQTIGFADTDGTSVAYGVGSESYTFALEKKTGSIKLPSVKLTFISSKGTAPEAQEMAENTVPEKPSDPTATGYNFGGWYTDEGCAEDTKFDFTKPLKENATVYAKWTAKETNVTLNVDGGTLPEGSTTGSTFTYDEEYTLPRPSRTGFRFDGWKTPDGTTIDLSGTWNREDENLTLKAAWVPKGDVPVKLDTQTYTYNGERHPFKLESTDGSTLPTGISVQYSVKGTNSFSTTAPMDVGEYDVKLGRAEDDEYNALDKPSTLVIEKATVALPTLKTNSFEYDGTTHTVELSESSDLYTLDTSSATAKDKGEYWVKVMINEACVKNYKWASLEGRDDVCAVEGDPDSIALKYTITPKKITPPAADTASYTYNGENQTYQLTLGEGMELAADGDDQTQKNAGTYTIKVALTDKENTTWSDGTTADKAYTFTIAKKPLAVPMAANTELTYNNDTQTLSVTYGTGEQDYISAVGESAKNVGSYTATYTIKPVYQANYCWAGNAENVTAVTIPYTIKALEITPPTAGTKTYTYSGDEQTYEFATEDDKAHYTVTDNKRTNAGTQKVTIALNDKENTVWSSTGKTDNLEYTFTIAKKPLDKPEAEKTSFTYNGNMQTLQLQSTDYSTLYMLIDNNAKNAGSYNAMVTLTDPDNYCWKGETGASFPIPFSITKADRSAPDIESSKNVTHETIYKKADGEIRKVDDTMEYKLEGADSWTAITGKKLTGLAAGKYSIRYKENDNYNASSAIVLTVEEGRKLTVTFQTAGGSTVDPQTDLGYGDPVAKPDPAPDYTGFTLVGWYKDVDYKNVWDFATDRVEDDTELYAKWELSIGIEGDARFTEGKAPAEGVKIIVGKGLDQTETPTLDLKKVTVDGKKLDAENYTVAYGEDGLTITLKQEYLNTLEDDEYEIGVVADSEHLGEGRKLSVTLTVEPEQIEAEGGNKPAGKPGKAVKTGDSSDLLLWSILSLGAGAGLVCIGKKRREN